MPLFARRRFLAGSVGFFAAAPWRTLRAATSDLAATITLGGGSFLYRVQDGADLGDFVATIGGFTQGCIRVARDDCPLTVFFRPDRSGDRLEVVFELGDLWRGPPQNLGPYQAVIAAGGNTLAAIDVPRHFWFSRWRWQSAARPIVTAPAALIAQGLLPPYRLESSAVKTEAQGLPPSPPPTDKGAALGIGTAAGKNGGHGAYRIMELAGIEPHMGSTGERPDIGLITEAQARYVCTGDNEALNALRAQAEAAGTLPWHMRDSKTGAPVDLDAYPTMSWYPDGNVGHPRVALTDSGIALDAAHQPALAYLPYMLTGDPYHLEDLQFAATTNRGSLPPEYRLSIPQTRAFAWSTRTLAQAAKVTPDNMPRWLLPKAYWQRDLARTRDWFWTNYVQGRDVLQRVFHITDNPASGRDEGPTTPEGTWTAPWMDEFLAAVLGWMVLMGHDDWRPAFDWKLANTLARTDGKSGWMRACATPYRIILRPDKTAPYVNSWADAWALTSRLQNLHPASPDQIEVKDPTYLTYTRGVLAIAAKLGVDSAKPNLAWLDDQLRRHRAETAFKWQIV